MEQRPDYRKVQRAVDAILYEQGIAEPPINPISIARDKGVSVFFVKFSDEARDISGFYDCDENAIFVNRDEYPLRQTFTVAHELGHKVLHEQWAKSADYKVLLRDTTQQVQDFRESEANAFAAGLLMPKKVMDRYWNLPLEQLSELFAVSIPAMRNRLAFLYGI